MQSHDNTAKAHIGAESSSTRSSIAKRALQQAKALRRSDTTHFRWSSAVECLVHPMQASSRWDPTRGDLCSRLHARATDFHFENGGTGIVSLISTSPRGLRGSAHSISDITDKLGSGMPAANADGPNLQRTIPSVRSKTD